LFQNRTAVNRDRLVPGWTGTDEQKHRKAG